MKEYIIDDIKRETKNVLYYMAKAADDLQHGKDPVFWLARATEKASDLKVKYMRAEDLEIHDTLDFKQIYADALKQARTEVENDD